MREFTCEYFEPLSFAISERYNQLSYVFTQHLLSFLVTFVSLNHSLSILTFVSLSFFRFLLIVKFEFSLSVIHNMTNRRSINIVVFLLECIIIHMLIDLIIIELTYIKPRWSRILSKILIKLFLVVTRKVDLSQLSFRKLVKPLVYINWESISFSLGYIKRINWNLSALAMSV